MLKFLKKIFISENIYGLYCPECSMFSNQATAFYRRFYDKRFKKLRVYIKCEECKRTTPAFENKDACADNWNYLWEKHQKKLLI